MATKAVIYPRVSSVKQEDGVSLADQERDGRAYCARMGWDVATVIPETYSGFESMDVRPGLQQALDMMRRGEAQVLVVWRADRLARDMTDMALIHRELTRAGGRLESATEGAFENTPEGRLILQLKAYLGEGERNAIISRTHRALRTRAESGKLLIGRNAKYGYAYVGERKASYAIDEETGPIVKRIFDMSYDGRSLFAIAKKLNEEHIPTPTALLAQRGVPTKKVTPAWTRQMVYQLLQDSSYCGRHVVYRRQHIKTRVHDESGRLIDRHVQPLRREDDAKRLVQSIPAIVSEEVWNAVQRNLKERSLRHDGTNKDPDATLLNRGFGYCGHCGARIITAKHHAGFRMYQCRHGRSAVAQACSGGSWAVKASDVDRDVWAKVVEMGGDLDHVRRMIQARREGVERGVANIDRDKANIVAEIADCEQQQELLVRRVATEPNDRIAALYRADILKLQETLDRLHAREEGVQDREKHAGMWLAAFEDVNKVLDMHARARQNGDKVTTILPRDEKRKILRALGVKVLMYSTTSEFARTHDTRWDFQLESPVVVSPYSWSAIWQNHHQQPLMFTWADWLAVA